MKARAPSVAEMHIQPNGGLTGLRQLQFLLTPRAGSWDNTQVGLCNQIASQIAGFFGSIVGLGIQQFALLSPSHSGQIWSQNPPWLQALSLPNAEKG